MGCSSSTLSQELPEKLNWTRPDFDELCSKGENSLKLLNELKHGVLASWDRICSKFDSPDLTPALVYILLLLGFSQESQGDFLSIDLHLAHTLPGYSKVHVKNLQLMELIFFWEEFCNELLGSIPKVHSIQEDIIQTANVYHQVMAERLKTSPVADDLDKEVESAVQKNLKILSDAADFFHQVLQKIISWVESLSQTFSSLGQEKLSKLHHYASLSKSTSLFKLPEKDLKGLSSLL
jgi:hypothetical protein